MTTRELIRKTADVRERTLKHLEDNEERRQDRPTELSLGDIHVANEVFQWRLPDEDMLEDNRFVEELVDALEVQEQPVQPFDPLLVVPIGQRFFVVDGHHRLDAYHTFNWDAPVPVEVFDGTLREAKLEAWKRNARNKLRMSTASRFEAAWKLIKNGEFNRTQITQLTSVRRSTLTNMRNILSEFGDRARVLPWQEARRLRRDQEEPIDESWKEKIAREIALHLVKGPKQIMDPELLAMGLRMAKEGLPAALVADWPDAMRDVLLGCAEEECPEVQDDIHKVFQKLFTGMERVQPS